MLWFLRGATCRTGKYSFWKDALTLISYINKLVAIEMGSFLVYFTGGAIYSDHDDRLKADSYVSACGCLNITCY